MIAVRWADAPWIAVVLGVALLSIPLLWTSPLLVIAVIPALAGLLGLAARPAWILPLVFGALMVSDGINFDLRVGVVLTVGKLGMLFVLAAWGLHCLAIRRSPVEPNGFWLAHGAMLAVLVLGLGINRFADEQAAMYVFGYLLLGVMVQVIIAVSRAGDLRPALTTVALVYLAVLIAGWFFGERIVAFQFSRNAGFGGDPNYWALHVLMGLPPTVAILENARSQILRVLAVGVVFIAMAVVLATASRAGLLVLAATAPLLAWILWRRRLTVAAFGGLAFLLAPLWFDFDSIATRIAAFSDESEMEMDGSLRDRSIVARFAFDTIATKPVFGLGTRAFSREVEIATGGQVHHVAHNTYLGVLAELGVVGGITFMGFVGYLWALLFGAWRRKPDPASRRLTLALACSLIAYLLFCLTLDALYVAPGFFWFAILVGHATGRSEEAVGVSGAPAPLRAQPAHTPRASA